MNAEDYLRRFLAVPSVNPVYTDRMDLAGEGRMADTLADTLRDLGAEVRVEPVESGRPNVLARFAPPGPVRRRIVLAPHLDTVGVNGMTVDPFSGETREGRLYGRGACDTKGPMAAAVAALEQWVRSPARAASTTEWIFAGLMDEEHGQRGSLALCRSGFRADFAVALEPTGLKAVYGLKGNLRAAVELKGRAGHGSDPGAGINAIYRAAPVLAGLERLAARWTECRHPLLGPVTLNVGTIAGGQGVNIVPDRCVLELEVRGHPDFGSDRILRDLDELLATVAPDAVRRVVMQGSPMLTDPKHPLVAALGESGKGLDVAPWFSDANRLSEIGIPSVVFGPGSIAQAHTADEYIEIAELERGADALFRFMERCG
jgi:acetylornithine deacetylase/succinyl-diaminopimelate desuccinylase-like protein